nr:MAG TPA: hypothetical protein [Caudoviricetes sp.]
MHTALFVNIISQHGLTIAKSGLRSLAAFTFTNPNIFKWCRNYHPVLL